MRYLYVFLLTASSRTKDWKTPIQLPVTCNTQKTLQHCLIQKLSDDFIFPLLKFNTVYIIFVVSAKENDFLYT
jgi:hypothetical protein